MLEFSRVQKEQMSFELNVVFCHLFLFNDLFFLLTEFVLCVFSELFEDAMYVGY